MRKATKGGLRKSSSAAAGVAAKEPIEAAFDEVVSLIRTARLRAAQLINTETTDLYWNIGRYPASQDRGRRLGQGHGGAVGCPHRAARTRQAWLLGAESVAHAAILRDLPRLSKTLNTVERIAVVIPSAYSEPLKAP